MGPLNSSEHCMGRGKKGIVEKLEKQALWKEEIQPEKNEKGKYDRNFKRHWFINTIEICTINAEL